VLESLENVYACCSLITSEQNGENDESNGRRLDTLDEKVWPALKATRKHEHECKTPQSSGRGWFSEWFMLVCRELNQHTTNYTHIHSA